MSSRNSGEIKSALLKKGFSESNTDHKMYVYVNHGKVTDIRTIISHGKKEYGDSLLGLIKKQMKLDSKETLLAFIDCTFSKDDYHNYLLKNQYIK